MRQQAERYLKQMLGLNAQFHPGQFDAIESVFMRIRTLVVQKTGWGKSIVYFIATKMIRDNGGGITILISPLLSLMRNQIETAQKIGIKAETLNSENEDDWDRVEEALRTNNCDVLLVSPERLGNDRFRTLMSNLSSGIGMLVVDEAHCISNWGHDFRPDYKRIVDIISNLPSNVPVLATTATANDRVIQDISEQLGHSLKIIRGPLTRESLKIQIVRLHSQAERLAWLLENLPSIDGSGIIYCLTIADCKKVASWLKSNGIDAYPYYSKVEQDYGLSRADLETKLLKDDLKVLVATDALGMGFDKPNLAFVIHFQRPGSVVAYYQQIGRAGRGLENAFAVLLTGDEDNEIQDYFINSAFPSKARMADVVNIIEESNSGSSVNDILRSINISKSKVEQCLKLLEIEKIIYKDGSRYFRTVNAWNHNNAADVITEQRYNELRKMEELCNTDLCFMEFVALELNDCSAKPCGKCANCLQSKFFPDVVDESMVAKAIQYLKGEFLVIKPRKMWPAGGVANLRGRIPESLQNFEGRALSLYGDAGWGKLIREDRYVNKHFRDELVNAAALFIMNTWSLSPKPSWVTSVPSLRNPTLVASFAQRLAIVLGIQYVEQLEKTQHSEEQKNMRNSNMQVANIAGSFRVKGSCQSGNVILIDDIMNSGWTFTVCGMLLREAGSGDVYPFALASTAGGSDMD